MGRLTIQDIRKAGFCVRGAMQHMERAGFDARRLVKEGIPLEEFEGVEDSQIQRAIRVAEQRLKVENG